MVGVGGVGPCWLGMGACSSKVGLGPVGYSWSWSL